jgi:hypothetical protein
MRSSRLSQLRESQNSRMKQGAESPVMKQELRSFTPTAEMLAESEANLRSGADAMQVAQDLAQDLFHTRMKEFIEQYEGLLTVGEANRATIQEQKETIKDLQT